MTIIEDGLPAIISKADFNKVQEKMEKGRQKGGRHKARASYLLSGLIFCGECGHAMAENYKTSKNKPYPCYRCSNKANGKQCENFEIRKEVIEEYVLDQLEEKIFNDHSIPLLIGRLKEYHLKPKSTDSNELIIYKKQLKDCTK